MEEYDSLVHKYGEMIMYQAETKVVQYIGEHESATVTGLAQELGKSPSAYSQIVRKLRQKGLVKQVRNEQNNREYMLLLTELGWQLYKDHNQFEQACYERTLQKLMKYSDDELKTFCDIQNCLNEAFEMDVEDSRSIQVPEETSEKRQGNA